ncbi:MAG: cardiolipin synthase [Saprospiraceae bacterium]|nr:MAG: cardiolipin synthase [Saprospiraceae bacterium]
MKKLLLKFVPVLLMLIVIAVIFYSTGIITEQSRNPVWELFFLVLVISYATSIFFSIGILLMERGDPVKTLSWIVIMLALPIIGLFLYSFLGASFKEERVSSEDGDIVTQLREHKKKVLKQSQIPEKDIADSILKTNHELTIQKNIRTALHNPRTLLSQNNKVKMLVDGEDTFNTILEDLATAQHHIHLEYFIWTEDELGQKIREVLIAKVKEGVTVRLILDGLGCIGLSNKYIGELQEAGIETLVFRPVRFAFMNSHSNFRNHRKIIVIDGHTGFTGGINVDGKYLKGDPILGHWRDTHLRLEGDAVKGLQMTFLQDWAFLKGERVEYPLFYPKMKFKNQNSVQVIASAPDTEWDGIKQLYLNTLYTARDYVYLATPYFIPNNSLLNAIKSAAQSGVDVRLIIPSTGDSTIVQAATMSFAEELLHCSVKVYQYQKGFIHSKVMIADDVIGTIGSANLDIRSFDQNLEINAVLYDTATLQEIKTQFHEDLKNSKKLTLDSLHKRSFLWRLKQSGCRLLAPLL